jgi:glycosyltransferase involved in cell wall biosynthesis
MFINWALGLKAVGVEVLWLDSMLKEKSCEYKKEAIQELKQELLPFGINDIAVMNNDGSKIDLDILECASEDRFENMDLLINLGYDLPEFILNKFKKRVFVDLDPGQTQVWISLGHLYLPYHDYYFTYGENVGKSPLIPTCGLNWIHTPPAISSAHWVAENHTVPSLVYTTVSNWWGGWFSYLDETFENSKRISFLKFKELPSYVDSPVEIAAFFSEGEFDNSEISMLEGYGWKIRHVLEVSDTPYTFQQYVQQSRGEFSCLLPAYTKLKTAWTSERSLNYLAAGKPVILTDTGESIFLPKNEGILRFSTMKEAVQCFKEVERNYDFHSKRAKEIIREYFDAKKVTSRLLEQIL